MFYGKNYTVDSFQSEAASLTVKLLEKEDELKFLRTEMESMRAARRSIIEVKQLQQQKCKHKLSVSKEKILQCEEAL